MKRNVILAAAAAALTLTGCSCANTESAVSYISSIMHSSHIYEASQTSEQSSVASSVVSSSQASSRISSLASSISASSVSSKVSSVSSKPSSAATSSREEAFTPDPDWNWALILVNKVSLLSEDYEPQISQFNSSRKFETRAMSYLKDMVSAAKADGIKLNVISSYRTYKRQVELYDAKVEQFLDKGYSKSEAEAAAALVVAPPGTSEHCTGLAADIVSTDWYDDHSELTYDFDKTEEYKWLEKHAAEYGFVLRYPKGKEDVTMIDYEPWHYRFVGVENAKYIKQNNLTLEEFVELFL